MPEIDLIISNAFYSANNGFQYKYHIINTICFRIVPILTKLFIGICLLYIIYLAYKSKNLQYVVASAAFFCIIATAIGPGLIVNGALKEGFGRPRPRDIIQFNGDKRFVKPFVISDQCQHNCSFSSGHAAMGFGFTMIAYIARKKYFTRLYIITALFGLVIGISRVIMGAHFASDVVASGAIILFLNHVIYILWKKTIAQYKKLQ